MDEVVKVLKHMQNCIHELRSNVEALDDNQGIQIGRSTFDYLDESMEELKNKLKGEM